MATVFLRELVSIKCLLTQTTTLVQFLRNMWPFWKTTPTDHFFTVQLVHDYLVKHPKVVHHWFDSSDIITKELTFEDKQTTALSKL